MLNAVFATGQVKEEAKSKTTITVGEERMKITNNDDATIIRLGSRIVSITEGEKGPKVNVERVDPEEYIRKREMIEEEMIDGGFMEEEIMEELSAGSNDNLSRDDDGHRRYPPRFAFRPHWSGFEFGFNSYLADGYESTLPAEYNFMDLNTGKSFNVNINFAQLGIGITRRFGLVTGMGVQFNDYVFEGNNNIMKDPNGVIIEYDAGADGIVLDKSKLSTVYFVMPLLMELQIPVQRHSSVNIAAGVIGGAKVASRTKMVYFNDGKQKIKEKNDYSLNLLRYGPTVRLGYESFQIYATYYMNGLFKEHKGPELYPVQIGIAFTLD